MQYVEGKSCKQQYYLLWDFCAMGIDDGDLSLLKNIK